MGTTTGAAVLLGIAVILQCGYLIESSAPMFFINPALCNSGQVFTFTNANFLRISLENGTCNNTLNCEIHIWDIKRGSLVDLSLLSLAFPDPGSQGQCVGGSIQLINGVTQTAIGSAFCGTRPAKFSPIYLSHLIIKVNTQKSGSCAFTFLLLYKRIAPGPIATPNPGTAGRIAGIVGGLLAALILLALLIWLIVACVGGPARVNWVLVRGVRRFTGPPVMKPPPPPRRPLPPIIVKILPPAWRPAPPAIQPAPQPQPVAQPVQAPTQPLRFGPLNLNIVLRHRPQLYLPNRQIGVQGRQMDFGLRSMTRESPQDFETRSAHMKIEDVSTADGLSTIRDRTEVRSAHMDLESEYDVFSDHLTLGPESSIGTVATRSGNRRVADTFL